MVFLPVRSACGVDDAHDGADALVERADRAVRLQLVVLDEIDAGRAELGDERRRLLGVEADARLDDGADQRAALRRPASRRVPAMPKRGPG